MLEKNVLIERF